MVEWGQEKEVCGLKRCVIFCAAEFDRLETPIEGALVIAADGGLRHAQKENIAPDLILGDFDSLGFVPEGAEVFPVEKDDTDAMLAVRKGLAAGCREFILYGALDGSRVDHTVANFQLLHYLAERGAQGTLVGLRQCATVIRNDQWRFPAEYQGIFSVFCMGADASGVDICGGQYPLQGGTLTAEFPLGVSNHFVGQEVRIAVEQGSLLIIWDRQ